MYRLDVLVDQPRWMKVLAGAISSVEDLRKGSPIVNSDGNDDIIDGEVVEEPSDDLVIIEPEIGRPTEV